jgi:hypothetical protein
MKLWDKVVIAALLIGALVFGYYITSFAGGVTDDNNGNQGYIFVSTGENHGKESVGRWVDPSDAPELKGDKGDTGAQGDTGLSGKDGLNGIDGVKGVSGDKGADGYTPIKNKDYFDGLNGLNGENGKDVDSTTVTNLQNNINAESSARASADTQLSNRIDSLSNRLSKLERTQFVAEFDFRIYDSKRLTISPFFRTNFTRGKIDTVGVRFTIKLGRSYEEKLIEKTNARVDIIERKLGQTAIVEKELDTTGHVKSIRIIDGGLAIDGTF